MPKKHVATNMTMVLHYLWQPFRFENKTWRCQQVGKELSVKEAGRPYRPIDLDKVQRDWIHVFLTQHIIQSPIKYAQSFIIAFSSFFYPFSVASCHLLLAPQQISMAIKYWPIIYKMPFLVPVMNNSINVNAFLNLNDYL